MSTAASQDQTTQENDLRYPVGKFHWAGSNTAAERTALIDAVASVPARLRAAVQGLSPQQLDTPYRPGGWTVRQVVHHLADSHLNSYARFRLALTEDAPTIKPYDEAKWAELDDARNAPIEESFNILDGVHARWVRMLRGMALPHFARTFVHPEKPAPMSLDMALALYGWHGRHHVRHITALRERNGW